MNTDDTSPTVSYSEGWAAFSNLTDSATPWQNGTFHQCASSAIAGAPTCQAVVTFNGTGAEVLGDSTAAKGRYFCTLKETESDRQWFDGGSISEWGLNRVLCRVTGLTFGTHQLVLGQTAADCGDVGIAFDYWRGINGSASDPTTWSSDFVTTNASPLFAAPASSSSATSSSTSSTSTSMTTTSTSSSTSMTSLASESASPTAVSGGSSTNTSAIGAGAGIGGAVVITALLGAIWWTRRRRNAHDARARAASSAASAWSGDAETRFGGSSPVSYVGGPAGWRGDRRTGTAYSARAATIPEVQPDDASSKMDFAASPTSPPRLTRAVSNGTSLPGLGLEDPAAFSPR